MDRKRYISEEKIIRWLRRFYGITVEPCLSCILDNEESGYSLCDGDIDENRWYEVTCTTANAINDVVEGRVVKYSRRNEDGK